MYPVLRRFLASLMAAAFVAATPVQAIDLVGEDTDLFLTNPAISSEIPNVLIVLDNTSNWSQQAQHWPAMVDATCLAAGITGNQQGDAEVCAIYKQVSTLTDSVNVGLMMFNDQNAGGYIRFPMKSMTATNRTLFQNTLKVISTNTPADKTSSSTAYENPLNDAFRYFNRLATYGGSGAAASPADSGGYTDSNKTVFSMGSGATSTCGYDYIIFIGNGFPNANKTYATELTTAAALLNDSTNVTPNTTPINATASRADVWTRFMYDYGTKVGPGAYKHITTYTIDVCKDQCDADQATVLTSMAAVSFGRYFKATNLDAISTALSTIFTQVQAVNSVFAATTLPVSINVRGTNLNQVYIGVFRPDSQLSPRWMGNLKQYELGVADANSGQLQLIDATGSPAINLNTGFVANTAKSYWTTSSSFWGFRAPFKSTDAGGASDAADGDLVEKGGAAQRIREVYPLPDYNSAMTRKIYTCTGSCLSTTGSALSGTLFNTANADITSNLLGTFATVTLTSLTASGTNATGTAVGHGFSATEQVTVSGASPSIFNGTFSITSTTADTFTYSLSPNTPDTTHAYVTLNTLANSGLTAATDTLTVVTTTGTTAYDVTNASLSAVAGNANQVSYALGSSPVGAASVKSVTANRRITSLTWDSATGRATVGLAAAHNYVAGSDNVTVAGVVDGGGAADTVLNGTFAVLTTTSTSFTYSTNGLTPSGGAVITGVATTSTAVPASWSAGSRLVITGVTGTDAAKYNMAGTESGTVGTISTTGSNSFTYFTNGSPTATATGTFSARKQQAADTNAWTVSAASQASSGSGSSRVFEVTLTLTQNCRSQANLSNGTTCSSSTSPSEAVAGQIPQAITTSTPITIAGVTCRGTQTNSTGSAVITVSGCSASNITPTSVTNAGGSSFTIKYRPAGLQGNSAPNNASLATVQPTTSSPTASLTGTTYSDAITVTQVTPGTATVTRTGSTMYVSKTGDLTSYVTSIANQSVATGTITAGLATNADPAERENLINWVRGLDNKDGENFSYNYDSIGPSWAAGTAAANDVRASVHGDVLHSRPAVINYNRYGDDNDVFVFYGANDGMFHAIKGGRSTGAGNEQWSFIAREHFGKLKRLRNQTPIISSSNPRDYFFDGPIGAYTFDATSNFKLGESGDKVYLFVGMRRGGRYIYALDVSDPTDPKFLWRKGCPNSTGTTGCDAGYAEMGQSWSEPKLGYVRAFGNSTLVLMFGAGYDAPVEDLQPCGVTSWDNEKVKGKTAVVFPNVMTAANCGSNLTTGTVTERNRTMGRGIYMVNALTGDVLWRAVSPNATTESVTGMTTVQVTGMDYAITADLAALKHRSNTGSRGTTGTESVQTGYLDRMYAVDTGGQVWRVDMSDATIGNWTVTKLASIAPSSGSTSASMRKFMFSPDVVYSSDANGNYDAVLVGSGDREHPFDQTVSNRFYMFKDRNTGTITTAAAATVTAITESNLFDVTNNCLQTASSCDTASGQTQATASASLLAAKGWMLQLSNTGEKTIATATTSAGTVIFNTNQPKQDNVTGTAANVGANSGNFCTSDLGTARQYGINYQNAVSNNIYTALPSQFQSGSGRYATFAGGGFLPAPVPVVVSIGGKYYQTVISGVQTTNPGGLSLQTRVRTYWYKKTN